MTCSSLSQTISPTSNAEEEQQAQHTLPQDLGPKWPKSTGPPSATAENYPRHPHPHPLVVGDDDDGLDQPITAPRPRGRPKGSKNKPKPPVIVSHIEPMMKTFVLEIATGSDIVETIHNFALQQNAGVSVVNGLGRVKNVTIRNPMTHEPSISFSGVHDVLSINGIHVGPAKLRCQRESGTSGIGGSYSYFIGAHISYLVVMLSGPRGVVWGGVVMGKLVAVSNILLNVSTFADYEFPRMGFADQPENNQNSNGDNGPGPSVTGMGPCQDPVGCILVDAGPMWDPNLSGRKRLNQTGNF